VYIHYYQHQSASTSHSFSTTRWSELPGVPSLGIT